MSGHLLARMQASGPKKILALDGGGIRGMITVEVLGRLEGMLREAQRRPSLVLADYFDFVAGTSTGAILAACIARGMAVAEIRRFYEESGPAMFVKSPLLRRFHHRFDDDTLAEKLREVFGSATTLGSDELQTVLMMVMRNASTDSPWPLSNNPLAKYNLRQRADGTSRGDCNLDLPLWQLVRASTAAPSYFPPEMVKVGSNQFVFVDGGMTTYNNPAFQAFLMATLEPYAMSWRASTRDLLVVSIGTGASARVNANLRPDDMNLIYNAGSVPSALMFAALNEQDMLCRVFGECRIGDPIDRELGDLRFSKGPAGADKMFAYVRYNAELSVAGLRRLGIDDIRPEDVQPLDSVAHLEELRAVGRALAHCVKPEHLVGFLPAADVKPRGVS